MQTESILETKQRFGMWVAFQYVLFFICLYVSATSTAGIFHYAVDKLFVDPLKNVSGVVSYQNTFNTVLLKGYISGIIVTFPIFAGLFLLLKKQALKVPEVKHLHTRKVLVYLTLIITFVLLIGHLISTIFGFLDGKTTANSLAHLGVNFLVAGSIFIYFLQDVWSDAKLHD